VELLSSTLGSSRVGQNARRRSWGVTVCAFSALSRMAWTAWLDWSERRSRSSWCVASPSIHSSEASVSPLLPVGVLLAKASVEEFAHAPDVARRPSVVVARPVAADDDVLDWFAHAHTPEQIARALARFRHNSVRALDRLGTGAGGIVATRTCRLQASGGEARKCSFSVAICRAIHRLIDRPAPLREPDAPRAQRALSHHCGSRDAPSCGRHLHAKRESIHCGSSRSLKCKGHGVDRQIGVHRGKRFFRDAGGGCPLPN